MGSKKALSEYFVFSRKDRLAVFAFLLILALLLVSPHFFPARPPGIAPVPDSLLLHADSKAAAESGGTDPYAYESGRRPDRSDPASAGWHKTDPFPFDPNTLDAAGWGRLGLPERVTRTILKYREKGGRFRRPEDLQRIWSLPAGFFEGVKDFIRIEGTAPKPGSRFPERLPFSKKERTIAPVSINEADSASLEALPGIGAKLASRILRFRERLGGFYDVAQVAETWGLPDSSFQRIRPYLILNGGKDGVRKFNLNTATKEELKVHPYLRWNLANAVVEYRNRHGAFTSVDELKKVMIISDSVFERIAPYFTIK
jgi:competence protein ComEA